MCVQLELTNYKQLIETSLAQVWHDFGNILASLARFWQHFGKFGTILATFCQDFRPCGHFFFHVAPPLNYCV